MNDRFIDRFCFVCVQNFNCRINPLTPNDHYSGRTAPLTFKVAYYIFIKKYIGKNILKIVYTLRFFS